MSTAWRALASEITACVACAELARSRQRVVVGEPPTGPGGARLQHAGPDARPGTGQRELGGGLALVGEAPGAAEDAAGRPFVGRAGQLLDQLLRDAALDRAEAAVFNVIKCRPPGNRAPRTDEVVRCRPFLERQLALLRPELVVALGLTAVTWFLGRTTLAAARDRIHEVVVAGASVRVIATYHPSAAIRFGPNGAPLAALRDDLALAAKLLAARAAP
jgi:DNA polymerase